MRALRLPHLLLFFGVGLLCARFAVPQTASARPPVPGRLIDVGGYRVHLDCRGRGSPTVVITGAGYSFDWSLVQPEVAMHERVCTYDHSGIAWSDPGPADSCTLRVDELHMALTKAGETAPFVLVGHSLGALVSRLYQLRYPEEVTGMVLVDHAYLIGAGPPGKRVDPRQFLQSKTPSQEAAEMPWIPPATDLAMRPNLALLPASARSLHEWADAMPTHQAVLANNLAVIRGCEATVAAAMADRPQPLGSRPLVVLGTGANPELGQRLARLSGRGAYRVVQSGHAMMIDAPGSVIGAIAEVVSATRIYQDSHGKD